MILIFFSTLFSTLRTLVLAIPILHDPLRLQLVSSNPALSSVYFPLPSSVLLQNTSTSYNLPALRVPPNWSFSIGLNGDTFLPGEGDSFSDLSLSVQLDNGDPIPDWLQFDPNLMTLDGETPSDIQSNAITVTASVGNVSVSDSFLLIISPHDLAIAGSFKTRNITTGLPFLLAIDDFERIILDDSPVNASLFPENPLASSVNFSLHLDTTAFPWMVWDSSTTSLSGTGPRSAGHYTLPVVASAIFPNQHLILSTNLAFNVFPSYFNTSWLPAQHIVPGSTFGFDLTPFTSSETRSDREWTLSIKDNSSAPWIVFDPAHLFLNGTIPQNTSDNFRVVISAHHVDHNVTNLISLDFIIDHANAESHGAKEKRSSHTMSGKVLRRILGISLAGVCVIVIALVSAFMLSRRRIRSMKRKSFQAIGVAYSYQDPALHKTRSRSPVQRVFDNFSLSSSPNLGGRFTTTRAVFDAIRSRLRGERFVDPNLSGQNQQTDSVEKQAKFMTRTVPLQRPRKSKIGRPIAILNGSSGLFSDFIANNLSRTVSFRQPQEKESQMAVHHAPISQPLTTLPPPHIPKPYPQFDQHSNKPSEIPPRPPNPVPESASDTSFNDVIPAVPPVPPKMKYGSSSMKAGDFLANKRKTTSGDTASTLGVVTVPSTSLSKTGYNPSKCLPSQPSYQSSCSTLPNGGNTSPFRSNQTRIIRPHFGDSSLEDIKEVEVPDASNDLFCRPKYASGRTDIVNQHQPSRICLAKGKEHPEQLLDSPNPSTEEYFGSASNESIVAANRGWKVTARPTAEKSSNLPSTALTVPSVYSDDPHSTSFPISSYYIAARQPFAFSVDVPKSDESLAVSLIAKQHNGAELPPWLRFDKAMNEFWGVTPDVKKGNAINVEIDLWDPRTNNVVAGTDMEVLG